MKLSKYALQEDKEVEESSKVERRKKMKTDQESSLVERALSVARQIDIPAATLVKELQRQMLRRW